ncbi:MAG TPA: ABC transporter permease [Candidatus Limnocylindria bacterium]|nr:ABC transporter permease [Candidatus Limnocylindria bacterium]
MIGRSGNLRMAVESIRLAKWRSLLTMLGIIIGVVSVVTTVSLGEGAKRGILAETNQAGADLITVRPGAIGRSRDEAASLFGASYTGTLSEKDYEAVSQVPGTEQTVPFSYVTNSISKDDHKFEGGMVIGTTEGLPAALGQKLTYGAFFEDDEPQRNAAVIGQRVAEQLFGENVPIGKYFTVRGKQFIIRGIFEEFDTSPLASGSDYNSAVFIQYDVGKELTGGSDIYQLLVRPADPAQTSQVAAGITETLRTVHAGQDDFAVLEQKDKLASANDMLTLMTGFVAGIAAISLIVGGIGILNIMLVAVTERTHEIGIRKAVGATNRQILSQFLTEAVILSAAGGVLGILFSLLTNYLFRIFTTLTPVLTWPIMIAAFGVAVLVGIIFGVTPALTAARKHPIDALRHE